MYKNIDDFRQSNYIEITANFTLKPEVCVTDIDLHDKGRGYYDPSWNDENRNKTKHGYYYTATLYAQAFYALISYMSNNHDERITNMNVILIQLEIFLQENSPAHIADKLEVFISSLVEHSKIPFNEDENSITIQGGVRGDTIGETLTDTLFKYAFINMDSSDLHVPGYDGAGIEQFNKPLTLYFLIASYCLFVLDASRLIDPKDNYNFMFDKLKHAITETIKREKFN